MMNKIVIIGAGGHGKVVADIALKNQYTQIYFVDDRASGKCLDFPIVGTLDEIHKLNDGETDFVIAVGDNKVRKLIAERYELPWVRLSHPSAVIASDVKIDDGTVIMAGAIINSSAVIGKHCIINSGSIIEHDNMIGDYVHISPNATLGGTVQIGNGTHIGLNAGVRNNIKICEDCTIGVGAVVINNLNEKGVYVGVPARLLGGNKM